VRWELERSLGGQLCQEYLYQKLLKSDNPFASYNRLMSGSFFETQCSCHCYVTLINLISDEFFLLDLRGMFLYTAYIRAFHVAID